MAEPLDQDGAEARGDDRPWLAGTLSALSILEVVELIYTSLKSGELRLTHAQPGGSTADQPPHRRGLYFREGQLVFAASSESSDRLGPVLWRSGLLDWDTLQRCGAEVDADLPLGQVLVNQGIITAADLYAGVGAQVREILFASFLDTEGEFIFVEGPYDDGNVVRQPERTRDLLLEGLKRVEEVERLLAGVGGRSARLVRVGPVGAGASEFTLRFLEALEGSATLAEAASESRLGLLVALREAMALLGSGVLASTAPAAASAPPPPAEARPGAAAPPAARPAGPFELYRRIFRRVHAALAQARPGAERRLDSYFERLPERRHFLFEGVGFDADGELDVTRVLANVTASGAFKGAAARARSLEALEDLLTFALFEVKNVLPRAQSELLLREVGRMQVGKA